MFVLFCSRRFFYFLLIVIVIFLFFVILGWLLLFLLLVFCARCYFYIIFWLVVVVVAINVMVMLFSMCIFISGSVIYLTSLCLTNCSSCWIFLFLISCVLSLDLLLVFLFWSYPFVLMRPDNCFSWFSVVKILPMQNQSYALNTCQRNFQIFIWKLYIMYKFYMYLYSNKCNNRLYIGKIYCHIRMTFSISILDMMKNPHKQIL